MPNYAWQYIKRDKFSNEAKTEKVHDTSVKLIGFKHNMMGT